MIRNDSDDDFKIKRAQVVVIEEEHFCHSQQGQKMSVIITWWRPRTGQQYGAKPAQTMQTWRRYVFQTSFFPHQKPSTTLFSAARLGYFLNLRHEPKHAVQWFEASRLPQAILPVCICKINTCAPLRPICATCNKTGDFGTGPFRAWQD